MGFEEIIEYYFSTHRLPLTPLPLLSSSPTLLLNKKGGNAAFFEFLH